MDKYTYIANSDGAYIEDLYNSYKQDSASVDEGWQKFFEGYDFSHKYPERGNGHTNGAINGKESADAGKADPARIRKEMEVVHLIRGGIFWQLRTQLKREKIGSLSLKFQISI
jgi:2-oxoglutarate dehydrogenase E1 component